MKFGFSTPAEESSNRFIFLFTMLIVASAFNSSLVYAAAPNSVRIESNLDPNAITITEVDIVFLYDDALIAEFPQTKSRWYSMRRTLTRRWEEKMDVVSVFIPQGFDADTAILPDRKDTAVKVYVFGQHDEASMKPADVTTMTDVLVTIDDLGIIVSSKE